MRMLLFWFEIEGDRVDTVPITGAGSTIRERLRAIIEDVSEMTAAGRTRDFDSVHTKFEIIYRFDRPTRNHIIKARPAAMGIKLAR